MHPKLKKMEKREDGYLELQLKKREDFDEYLYGLMNEDKACIPCIRDPMHPVAFYYDLNKGVPLSTYLEGHAFCKYEFISFMIYFLESFIQVNVNKPIYIHFDYILLYEHQIQFLVFPLKGDGWKNQNQHMIRFLQRLMKMVHSDEEYEAIGFVYQCLKEEQLHIPALLTKMKTFQEEQKKKVTFFKRLFFKDVAILQGLPSTHEVRSLPFQIKEKREEVERQDCFETMVLFDRSAYLEDVKTHEQITLLGDTFTIGRSVDNDLVLKQKEISAYHACIQTKEGRLKDLSSSNGTSVNQKRIHDIKLQDQDEIAFANVTFIYHKDSHNE